MTKAFTLAEVLITLGIIGIVVAMTMPALIAEHQKKIAAVRLEKFYSVMSQAVLRWQNDDAIEPNNFTFDSSAIKNGEYLLNWYNTTIGKYIQSNSVNKEGEQYIKVALNDGSGFVAYIQFENLINIFYCVDYKYCAPESYDGRRTFLFSLNNGRFVTSQDSSVYNNMSRDELLEECKTPYTTLNSKRHACTRLIQVDGWRIAKDYPW